MIETEKSEETTSEQAKRNFLARMSHEMRTPLNAIIGMSTIAQTSSDLERITQCLVKINDASLHLLGMINDILDLASIESGNLKLSISEFDFAQALKKVTETIRFSLDAKRLNLILDFDPNLPSTIISDQQRLIQVLDNLLSNAVKFTPPEGTITFSVKKLKETGGSSTLEIKVKDTGIGISGGAQKKIFSLFEQADGTTVRKYEGSGIGLAICSSIVHLMGGNIQVNSEPGKGSCFGFEITVECGTAKTPGDASPVEIGEVPGPDKKPKFSGKTILLSEDVEINREIVLSLLEDTGITIDCAENGLGAVKMFSNNSSKYSLILMDIHMPEMDGLEATRQIRAVEKELGSPGIPIIAMTANVFNDDVEKCLEAGMTSHLGKPIDFEDLMKELDKYLSQP